MKLTLPLLVLTGFLSISCNDDIKIKNIPTAGLGNESEEIDDEDNQVTVAAECLEAADLASTPFQTGDGSALDPYTICTPTQLNSIGDNYLDKHFKILQDLDMSGVIYNIIGSNEWVAMDYVSFEGTIDGGGFEIFNLTQNSSSFDAFGLVGRLATSGVLKNINIVNGTIDDSLVGTFNPTQVGGLAGVSLGTIENCSFQGTIKATKWNGSAGGLVGQAGAGAEIINSYAKGNVISTQGKAGGLMAYSEQVTITNSYFKGYVSAERQAGGLVAELYPSSGTTLVTNSFAEGYITTLFSDSGGLIGNAYTDASLTISKSYFKGSVIGGNYTGGLIGYADQPSSSAYISVLNSYHRGDVTGANGSAGGLFGYAADIYFNYVYSSGVVTAALGSKGGIIGEGQNYVPSANNKAIWNSTLSTAADPVGDDPSLVAGLTGLTTAQMKSSANYPAGFDFSTIWAIDPLVNDGFPTLR